MTPEPQRLQYLEAMGLTAWASRYRLPNALPTPACEWETASPEAEGRRAPGERLHALLDEAAEAQVAAPRPAPAEPEPRHRLSSGKARALLGDLVPAEAKEAEHEAPRPGPVQQRGEALRFTLQVACLDGRWLVLLPGKAPPAAWSCACCATCCGLPAWCPNKCRPSRPFAGPRWRSCR